MLSTNIYFVKYGEMQKHGTIIRYYSVSRCLKPYCESQRVEFTSGESFYMKSGHSIQSFHVRVLQKSLCLRWPCYYYTFPPLYLQINGMLYKRALQICYIRYTVNL